MLKIKNKWIIYLALFSIIPLMGCANNAKLVLEFTPTQPRVDDSQTTMATLAENWMDYDIHFSGNKPALAKGILFDPKDDDKILVPRGESWVKVEDEETLRQVMKWIAGPMAFNGRLFRILSPSDQFFGYLYTYILDNYAGLRVMDENTIAALPIQENMNRLPHGGSTR